MKVNNYSVPIIVSMIQNKYKLGEARFYKSDLSASDLLVDLEIIIERANLTDKQAYILKYYWVQGYTQEEVAKSLGVTQQMIDKQCKFIKKKIEKVLGGMNEI